MASSKELHEKTEELFDLLMSAATGGGYDDTQYRQLRAELISVPRLKAVLPQCVLKCRDMGAFWSFIKNEFAHYEERRQFLRRECEAALHMLESEMYSPTADSVAVTIAKLDSEHVADAWRKALDRRNSDPEGAITAARTLLESVCKHILDDLGCEYQESDDLPKLYGITSAQLKLSPAQHTEQVFKQILGGCRSVVEGLGALRNKLSDAHGKGLKAIKPAPRHAELAVNLAGGMAIFLVSTWENQSGSAKH